jgi:hypothetical protein
MKKKLILLLILIISTFTGCIYHTHHYRAINNDTENELTFFCAQHDKQWWFDRHQMNRDSVYIQSIFFKDLETPMLMETSIYRENDPQKTFKIKIGGRQFHKLAKKDTITIKYKTDQKWMEEKFIIVPNR